MTVQQIKDMISETRKVLMLTHPFFGEALTKLSAVTVLEEGHPLYRKVSTACVCDRDIFINAGFFSKFSESEGRFVLMHEMLHIMFMHTMRAKELGAKIKPKEFNIACDCLVNWNLHKIAKEFIDIEIPMAQPINSGVVLVGGKPVEYSGQKFSELDDLQDVTTEDLFAMLVKRSEESKQNLGGQGKQNKQGGQGQSEQDEQDGQGQSGSQGSEDEDEDNSGSGNGCGDGDSSDEEDSNSGNGSGDNDDDDSSDEEDPNSDSDDDSNSGGGDSSNSDDEDGDEDSTNPDGEDGDDDSSDSSNGNGNGDLHDDLAGDLLKKIPDEYKLGTSGDETEQEVEEQISDILRQVSNLAGSSFCPGILNEFRLRDNRVKVIEFEKFLRKFVSAKVSDERSYLTPEKKYLPYDLIQPGAGGMDDELGGFSVFIDTSGSVNYEMVKQCIYTTLSIVEEFGCEVDLYLWTTRLYFCRLHLNSETLNASVEEVDIASGGTDVGVVFEAIKTGDSAIKNPPKDMFTRLKKSTGYVIFTDGCFSEVDVPKRIRSKTIFMLFDCKNPTRDFIDRIETMGKATVWNPDIR